MLNKISKIVGIYILFIGLIACNSEIDSNNLNSTQSRNSKQISSSSLKKIVDSLNIDKNKLIIKIYKSKYKMELIYDTTVLKTFPVVFGENPVDDKLKQGDRCTPEGEFGIRSKYPHKSWSKFIWIDYPNKDSWKKYNKAIADGKIKPRTDIGGEVGIHGVPDGYDYIIDERQNWTWGCISLKNKDVDDLYESIGSKTKIRIYH